MKYYTISPPADLAPYVRFFWVLESDEPYCHRSVADGCAEMVFHYEGEFRELKDFDESAPSSVSGLHGPSQQYRRFITQTHFGIFGVYLYPYALPILFGAPASEFTDEMVELESLPGRDVKLLTIRC